MEPRAANMVATRPRDSQKYIISFEKTPATDTPRDIA